jgi:hypothetical protein
MPPTNPQSYIYLSDGYLTLDSCKEGVYPGINRGLQINIGGKTQLQIQPGTQIVGQGTGVLGVDNNGNIFWSSGGGGGGTPSGPAGGDLGGSYPNPQVAGLLGNALPILATGNLSWSGTAWQFSAGGIPSGTAGGDLTGTYPNPQVKAIWGWPVNSSMPLTNQVLEWNGSAWVPTSLPSSLPPSGAAGGDLSGTYPNPEVSGLLNYPLPALADGYLNWTGTNWQLSNLTGLSPGGAAGGDLTGTYPNPTVAALNGVVVSAIAPSNNYLLMANSSSTCVWNLIDDGNISAGALINVAKLAGTLTGGQILLNNGSHVPTWTTMGGDTTIGATGSVSVVNIHGASVPASGSLTTGNVLQVSGSSALTYGAVNLAGGSNYVTGSLPAANQAAQNLTLTGDVTSSGGTTASNTTTVVGLRGKTLDSSLASIGATQDGYVLSWVNSASDWQAKPAPSGSFTAGGDLSGNSSSQTVIGLQGNPIQSGAMGSGNDYNVLTWVNTDSKWEAKPITAYFTASGTWVCPAGIRFIQIIASGGGNGGSGSNISGGVAGGAAGTQINSNNLPVTPGTSYTVTIGAGGTAGSSGAGGTGGNTTFVGGGLTITANGGGGAAGGAGSYSSAGSNGTASTYFAGGTGGPGSGFGGGGGGGGGGGTYGVGGNGGDGTAGGGAGQSGFSAAANSGAGGGGGSGNGVHTGGVGGSGYLYIIY